ncbi:MAG: hypothetical protein ACC662_01085 [Planctomycetota bacterium]
MTHDPPTPVGAALAYAISSLTMLLWVACVLPAGPLGDAAAPTDYATPMWRESWFLVPALLLLIIGPTGVVLSHTRTGRLAVLSAMDAFIAGYAGLALVGWSEIRDGVSAILVALLVGLGALSLYETARVLHAGPDAEVRPFLKGIRLAICTLVLLTPAWFLMREGRELGSLLVPFALIAISSGGAAFARAPLGLRFTASLVFLALAAHVFVTLRFTLFDGQPALERVGRMGWLALGLAGFVGLLALLQSARLWARFRRQRLARALAAPTIS